MNVSFSSSFLIDLRRIDNTILIDSCLVYNGGNIDDYIPEVIYNKKSEVCQACIVGSEESGNWECDKLEFYYTICGEVKLAFTVTNGSQKIVLNRYRTIFEFTLSSQATIGCSGLSEDTKFLEGPGFDLGSTLYKDIEVSEDSTLVWKESVGKYIMDKGIQEDHQFETELMDTKVGYMEERPIKFKSYQNITIEPGSFKIDTLKRTVYKKNEIYSEISSTNFFVWDSPMIDAKVNPEVIPTCYSNFGVYLDPGNVVFGNTDSFEYINYSGDQLKGFRITGTEGTIVDILLNKEYSEGEYVRVKCEVDSTGVAEVIVPDLPFYHLNGIISSGPCKVDKIEVIYLREEPVDVVVPNPDNTYLAEIGNVDARIKVDGICDYIEYEKYLGKISEIGRGTEHINSIPTLDIIDLGENGGLNYAIDNLGKQIICKPNTSTSNKVFYEVFQAVIKNNLTVSGNTITTSILKSDYKIKIEQSDIVWKFADLPDYVMEEDDDSAIFVLDYKRGSTKQIKILTNQITFTIPLRASMDTASSSIFTIPNSEVGGTEVIDGEEWRVHYITITTESENTGEWRPRDSQDNPYKVNLKYNGTIIESISFYAIQLSNIDPKLELWEETLPGKFTQVDDNKIRIFDSMVKNFIVVKPGNPETEGMINWYYYDLLLTNKFYLTDLNSILTNTGVIYIDDSGRDVISLGTNLDRETYEKMINVNRSDLVGTIGTLTITNSQSYPLSWRSLIGANTINVEVIRELTNIYIQVGTSTENIEDSDLVLSVSKIGVYSIYVRSNFKYTISINSESEYIGFLSFDSKDKQVIDFGEKQVFSGYSSTKKYDFALLKLDEEGGIEESWIEIKSGSVTRKITLKVDGPETTHAFYTENVNKPNLIRIFENGTISPQDSFIYTSTTTPEIVYNNISKAGEEETDLTFVSAGPKYKYHESNISFTVPGSLRLSYSKYPITSFGGITEKSLSYSEKELNPLEYYFYMKGKEHYLWCVDNISDFSGLTDPVDYTSGTVPSGYDKEDLDTRAGYLETEKNVYIDAAGELGKDLYILSRYGISNRTFITEYPKESEVKVKRNELEAVLKISSQEKINLDERTQIEYAIPIHIECNVQNNNGGVYLGSVEYTAKTEVTDFSVEDIISIPTEVLDTEVEDGKYGNYIKKYIVDDKVQVVPINIFQRGKDLEVFNIFTDLIDVSYLGYSQYLIPQIGENIRFIEYGEPEVTINGDQHIADYSIEMKTVSDRYYYLKVDFGNRDFNSRNSDGTISFGNKPRWWYDDIPNTTNLTDSSAFSKYFYDIVNDVKYTISVTSKYVVLDENGSAKLNPETGKIDEKEIKLTSREFTRYGSHIGFYAYGDYGFGWVDSPEQRIHNIPEHLSADGGRIGIHAGIFDAINAPAGGRLKTQALKVPAQYEFIGENIPDEVIWEDGNVDNDEGNLIITIPPRLRDDYGLKTFILHVTQPNEYYPLNLYVGFIQDPLINEFKEDESNLDIKKNKYKLEFEGRDVVNVYSSGEVEGGNDKLYFTHNLTEDMFNNVVFKLKGSWAVKDPEDPTKTITVSLPTDPDDLRELEEVERSYKDGYVKFKFKPNGSRTFINTEIQAIYTCTVGEGQTATTESRIIGSIPIKQGYYCLSATIHNEFFEDRFSSLGLNSVENYLSRKSPKLIKTLYNVDSGLTLFSSTHMVPCWTNSDNSKASKNHCGGRGVFHLKAYRLEFNEGEGSADGVSVSTNFKESSLIYMYPNSKLSSTGVLFGPSIQTKDGITIGKDYDARYDRYDNDGYFQGDGYITSYDFNKQTSYIEFSYTCKDEYIRDEFPITGACRITLIEEDTGKSADFYLAAMSYKMRSDQSISTEEIELSTYRLDLDYKEHSETVSVYPRLNTHSEVNSSDSNWLSTSYNTGKVKIDVGNNWSANSRRSQVFIDVLDHRGGGNIADIVLRSFVVDVIQDSVHVSLSDNLIRFGSSGGSKIIYIYPKELSPSSIVIRSGDDWVTTSLDTGQITVNVESNIPLEGEISYFRTAQISFNVEKDGIIIDRFEVDIEQTSGNDPNSESDPDLPLITPFNDLLESFGNPRVNEETPETLDYITKAVELATSEYNSGALVNSVGDLEVKDYRGNNNQYEGLAKDAMYSWLLAMCLSELVPSNSVDGKTNNQTKLYQKAYELGGGRKIPLYGNYTPKGDVMLARLIAGMVYAKNRSSYTFSQMDTMRDEMRGSTIDLPDWSKLGYDSSSSSIGYNIATNDIFPSAPGPFLPSTSSRTYPPEQSSDQFYAAGTQPFWYNKNYKVDVEIDTEVTTYYNLAAKDDYLKRTVQAVADDSESTTLRLGEKTYYTYSTGGTTNTKSTVDNVDYYNNVPNPRFTFQPGTPSSTGNAGYFEGTFSSSVTGKDLSSMITDSSGNPTAVKTFMDGVRVAGQNVRIQLYDVQAGRGRPSHGTSLNSSRVSPPVNNDSYKNNWLDDKSIERLVGSGTKEKEDGTLDSWYIDSNGNGHWDSGTNPEPVYNPSASDSYTSNLFPRPGSYTYPSGHSAGVFSCALFMTQIFPTKYASLFSAAYDYSISRTIVRAHWNSDVIYGRVIGTMGVPLINAVSQFRSVYNNAYDMITGGSPTPPTDASYAEYTGGNGIKYVLHNNSGIEARFTGGVTLNLSKNPDDWENSTQAYANMYGLDPPYKTNEIIIPPGGTFVSPEVTVIKGIYTPEVDFTDGTWYLMNTMKQPAGHPVYLYTIEFSRTRQYSSSSNHMYAATPTVNTKLQKGYTYHLNVNWVNDRAMLADASLTKDDFNKNYESYGYAILAKGKTDLLES